MMQKIEKELEKYNNTGKGTFLFTGDKGSTLLMKIVKSMSMNIIFIDTGYHFVQTVNYVKSFGGKIDVLKNNRAFAEYKNDQAECCLQRKVEILKNYLNKINAEYLVVPFSDEEKNNGIENSYLNGINTVEIVRPLSSFEEKDIWMKIKEYKLPFAETYNKGYKMLDCKPCTTRFGRMRHVAESPDEDNKKVTEEKLRSLGYM